MKLRIGLVLVGRVLASFAARAVEQVWAGGMPAPSLGMVTLVK